MFEDLLGWYPNPSTYVRNLWYTQAFSYFTWLGAQGKLAVTRALIPTNDANALPIAFVVYSLLKGPNFFFAPGQGSYNIDPAQWASMKALLGSPTSTLQGSQPSSLGSGYRLFWRDYQGGIVYLNWTGSTQTVQLPGTFYDPSGNEVTQIQIPDGIGTYVSSSPPTAAILPPRISPRYVFPAIGPITVTMEEDTPGTTIHYTIDGSIPTSGSPIYTGPFQISSTTVVQAIACVSGNCSLPSAASYTVSSASLPTVQFTLTSDSGSPGSYYPSLSLDAIPLNDVSITYTVIQPNGSSTTGTAKFLTAQMYSYFPITVSGLTTITITGATGAVVGPNNTLQYSPQ
jgi:Fn3 associated